jgi:ribosomal-protein-alanine N-acetyltransferase
MAALVPSLTTVRLVLRPLEISDAAVVQVLFPKWEIVQYLAKHVPWPYPADGALTFIRDAALPAMQEGLEWHWSIRCKNVPDRLIGVISLTDEPGNNRGFWLDPAWQGRGLMSEAVEVVTKFWFDTLDRSVLHAPKAAANLRSRQISQRSGMRVVERMERDYVAGRLPAEVWEITREEWRSRSRHINGPDTTLSANTAGLCPDPPKA